MRPEILPRCEPDVVVDGPIGQCRRICLAGQPGPTCGEVRERLSYRAHAPFEPASEFLYVSPFVPLHAELRAYGAESLRDDRPLAEAAIELMQRIHADFTYAPASTDISTPILTVLTERRGVCQDFAHLMLGCLRACGLAGRYVSGYLLTQPPPGKPRLIGADASHAWVSVYSPEAGWLDLDFDRGDGFQRDIDQRLGQHDAEYFRTYHGDE